ncbi:MAG: TIGR00159 family protein [Acidobacteria bacterium]|nr:TIGR00159 family protein [Acidobacteriota bacterium]MBI3663902.1 TIGR00159 family protein [Acidobacteriota bacterium]
MLLAAEFPWHSLSRLDVRSALDILIIAIIIYYVLLLLRGTRAAQMMVAVILIVVFFYGARWARLEMVEWLLTTLLPYFAIALIVLFQPEIRRALARAGRNPLWRRFYAPDLTESHDDVLLAVRHFSQSKIGALIVFEREVGLKTYIESGVPLDAALSYDLLVSIFRPGSPLHDGAAILQGNRIAAAACFLPLSLNPMITTQLGTRHRAAIGVTEESDAVAVVVSEQTGEVALASAGAIELHLTPELLAERLAALFAGDRPRAVLPARPQTVRE